MAGTREAADAAADAQERDLRRVAYMEYIDALDTYATATASRWETCDPGTDERLAPDVPCRPSVAEYQTSRHAFQGERNDMELIASEEALLLVTAIGHTMPTSNVGLTGEPMDGEPEVEWFTSLYSTFLEVAACDTSPNPRETCSYTRSRVYDVVRDVDSLRERLGGGSEASIPQD